MEKYRKKDTLVSATHDGDFDSHPTPDKLGPILKVKPLRALAHHPDISTPAVVTGSDIKNTLDK